jgi:hypothetical protein
MNSEPIDDNQWKVIESVSGEKGMTQLVIWQCIANAKRLLGKATEAETFEAKVRQKTNAFGPPTT